MQKVYFDDVKNELDSAKKEIGTKVVSVKSNEKKSIVILSDVQNKLDCTKDEIFLNSKASNTKKRIVKRGEIFNCNLGFGVGSEMRKLRPCVILSDNVTNFRSANVIIAPLTHTHKPLNSFVNIKPQKDENNNIVIDGSVNVADIRTVSKARLGNYITKISNNELKNINEKILDVMGVMSIIKGLRNSVTTKEQQMKDVKKKLEIKKRELEEIYSISKTGNLSELKELLNKLPKG